LAHEGFGVCIQPDAFSDPIANAGAGADSYAFADAEVRWSISGLAQVETLCV
jgi:hypothetical protein